MFMKFYRIPPEYHVQKYKFFETIPSFKSVYKKSLRFGKLSFTYSNGARDEKSFIKKGKNLIKSCSHLR